MSPDPRNDLPSDKAGNFSQRVRETLMTYMGRQGSPLDRGLTIRDLLDAGLLKIKDGFMLGSGRGTLPIGPGSGIDNGNALYVPDLTPPPTPTGFEVSAAITNLLLQTDAPMYQQGRGHQSTVIYGAIRDDALPPPTFADALAITEFPSNIGSYATTPATTWHLWVKWRTKDGVESTSPAGGTNGVSVTTGQDVSLLLTALGDKITSSELSQNLNSTIDLITGPSSVPGTVANRVAAESAARAAALLAESAARGAAISVETTARTTATGALQTQINMLSAAGSGDFSELLAAVSEEQTARIEGDEAEAVQRNIVAAQTVALKDSLDWTNLGTDVLRLGVDVLNKAEAIRATASVVTETNARTSAIAAEAEARQTLQTKMGQDIAAAVLAEAIARSTAISAEAQYRTVLASRVSANESAISNESSTRADETSALSSNIATLTSSYKGADALLSSAIQTESTARADAISAEAIKRETLQSTVAGNTAAIQTESSTRAAQTGALYAQKVTKLDVNGYVSGYGAYNDGATSQFIANVDDFAVTLPLSSVSSNWAPNTPYAKFARVKIPGVISRHLLCITGGTSGGTFPNNTDVVGNIITDNSVTWQVASQVPFSVSKGSKTLTGNWAGTTIPAGTFIDGAYVRFLNADNIVAGKITADHIDTASLDVFGLLNAGSVRVGQSIKSTGFTNGVPSWSIGGDGLATFNNAMVRGTLLGGSAANYSTGLGMFSGWYGAVSDANYRWRVGAPTGARIQWNGSAVEVYGPNGNLTLSSGGLAQGVAGNLLSNSDFLLSSGGWEMGWVQNGVVDYSLQRDLAGDSWRPPSTHVIGVTRIGTPTGLWDFYCSVPIKPNTRYEFSAKSASYRCNHSLNVWFYDINGAYITEVATGFGAISGGQSITNWLNRTLFLTTPSNAATAKVGVRSEATGETCPYTWLLQPMFCEAGAAQTEQTPWSPGNFAEQITSANASTYIASAAIGSAQIANASIGSAQIAKASITNEKIGDAQITNAKIGNAQIDTLKIGENAATICRSGSSPGGYSSVWVNTPYAADIQLIGTAAHSFATTITFYIDGNNIGATEFVQGTAVIALKTNQIGGHTYSCASGGSRSSIIVFASMR